jgi:hypothetical protein
MPKPGVVSEMKDEFVLATVELIQAWRAFQRGHDLLAAEISCCDVTSELWRALRQFEEEGRVLIETVLEEAAKQEDDDDDEDLH